MLKSIRLYGTIEYAGTFWRFFGPTYKTPELAQQAIDERTRFAKNYPMKVVSIRRIVP